MTGVDDLHRVQGRRLVFKHLHSSSSKLCEDLGHISWAVLDWALQCFSPAIFHTWESHLLGHLCYNLLQIFFNKGLQRCPLDLYHGIKIDGDLIQICSLIWKIFTRGAFSCLEQTHKADGSLATASPSFCRWVSTERGRVDTSIWDQWQSSITPSSFYLPYVPPPWWWNPMPWCTELLTKPEAVVWFHFWKV